MWKFNKPKDILTIYKYAIISYFNNFILFICISIIGATIFNLASLSSVNFSLLIKTIIRIIILSTYIWIFTISIQIIVARYYFKPISLNSLIVDSVSNYLYVLKVFFHAALSVSAFFVFSLVIITLIRHLPGFIDNKMLKFALGCIYTFCAIYILSLLHLSIFYAVLDKGISLKQLYILVNKDNFTILTSNLILFIIASIPFISKMMNIKIFNNQLFLQIYNILLFPLIGCVGITLYDYAKKS